jgi:hypothetical protein
VQISRRVQNGRQFDGRVLAARSRPKVQQRRRKVRRAHIVKERLTTAASTAGCTPPQPTLKQSTGSSALASAFPTCTWTASRGHLCTPTIQVLRPTLPASHPPSAPTRRSRVAAMVGRVLLVITVTVAW